MIFVVMLLAEINPEPGLFTELSVGCAIYDMMLIKPLACEFS
jgi:hypothetical protein